MSKTKSKRTKIYRLNLETRIEDLYSVGPAYSKRLKKLKIGKVRNLLLHFPFRYEDLSQTRPLLEAKPGTLATFKAKLVSIATRQAKNKRLTITEALVTDDTSTLKVIFFNQPYVLRLFRPGDTMILAGEVQYKPPYGKHLLNPTYEKASQKETVHLGRIVPIYPETKGVTSKWLRSRIKPFLKIAFLFNDWLPQDIKESLDLINFDEAIRQIHFPDLKVSLNEAMRRLSFDELFLIALEREVTRAQIASLSAIKIGFGKTKIKRFVGSLPFKLTNAQRVATWEIIQDLGKAIPMNRLLNGDVGSGKTVVAAVASCLVTLAGKQAAIMAPTEVLALQHFRNFRTLFRNWPIKLELLTNSYHIKSQRGKERILKNARGSLDLKSDITIGTHALIQGRVTFNDLALIIVDEQHRFGVKQRAKLKKQSKAKFVPHFLSMTATPIPRTLCLSLYGDLDISILDEMPKGRKQIKTHIIPPKKRGNAYEFIRKEVKKGRQVFVICPLIEKKDPKKGTELLDFDSRKAATEEYEKLKKEVFPELEIGLLHGKMKAPDKKKAMEKFKQGKIDILVSTSVVEVGVDVPNATIMMIDGAERFGLSQLHQFRGRVGRGKHHSFCFLFANSWGEKTKERLSAIKRSSDGFKIAEADLKLRGPGEVFGERQHGVTNLHFASLFDLKLVKQAKKEATKLVRIDPKLEKWPKLKKRMKEFEKEIHLE